jgi:hypothetical protein
MGTQQKKMARIQQMEKHIAVLPLREDLVVAEFERFRTTGELPEDQRLADAVVRMALRGGPQSAEPADLRLEGLKRLLDLARQRKEREELGEDEPDPPAGPPLREVLFNEAVFGDRDERWAARVALRMEVQRGADVTSPQFLADRSPPEHAGLGLQMLGFPQCLARPPYVKQAQRLLERFREIRARIDYSNPDWLAPIEAASKVFLRSGALPEDDLLRTCVLADGEAAALVLNHNGDGDPEVLAAFDATARAKDERSQFVALDQLRDLAWEGRLLPPRE